MMLLAGGTSPSTDTSTQHRATNGAFPAQCATDHGHSVAARSSWSRARPHRLDRTSSASMPAAPSPPSPQLPQRVTVTSYACPRWAMAPAVLTLRDKISRAPISPSAWERKRDSAHSLSRAEYERISASGGDPDLLVGRIVREALGRRRPAATAVFPLAAASSSRTIWVNFWCSFTTRR